MVSKSQTTLIHKLQQKKYRHSLGLFVVEGKKSILEFLNAGFLLEKIFAVNRFSDLLPEEKLVLTTKNELAGLSSLKNPDDGIAVFHIPKSEPITENGLIVALDHINDPGNLGTIIRLCDWFGIRQMLCSADTVDCYNPKVVQATMGSLARINIHYHNLTDFLKNTKLPVIAAVMDGNNAYKTHFPTEAILLMGNEANGISEENLSLITQAVTIPRFGNEQLAESLNVATATAILLSEIRRGDS
ncbi:MAG: RNA methyltransferase [Capnocytophaga sp.]|nr:RNA methyltransferase [Capnocytophaga sp.]